MTGVAADAPGSATDHLMFSVLLKVAGRFFSGLEPLWSGPRQLDQFSAESREAESISAAVTRET